VNLTLLAIILAILAAPIAMLYFAHRLQKAWKQALKFYRRV